MRSTTLGGVLALALTMSALSVGAVPAIADDRPSDPTRDLIVQTYGSTPPDWAPQGTVIAESGFDPAYDSFPFVNYSIPFGAQNALLGYPADGMTLGLTAVEAQRLFGTKSACTYVKDGRCVLNPAVASWVQSMNAGMLGGHCFGIAALVAGLFNGVISRAGLTPSEVNAGVALSPAVQRAIAQWFVTQQFVLSDEELVAADFLPPDQLVAQLVDFLPSGTLPYVLALFWEEDGSTAGHGITPYAVYSRGPNLVDIAVYDNNYPLQARAVHVDLAANTWEYQVFASPGEQPVMASGDATSLSLGLIPLAQLTGQHECDFCADAPEGRSLLTVAAASEEHPDDGRFTVQVQDVDGQPLKGVRELPGSDTEADSRTFSVPTSADYRVRIEALDPGESMFTVSSFAPGEALSTFFSARQHGVGDVVFRHVIDQVAVTTNEKAEKAMVRMSRDRRSIDHDLTILATSKAWKKGDVATPDLRISERKDAIVVDATGAGRVEALLLMQRISPATGATLATTSMKNPLTLQAGDRIVVDTSTWRSGQAPRVTLTTSAGSTRRPSVRVTGEDPARLVAERAFGAVAAR